MIDMTLTEREMDPTKLIWFSKSKDPFGFLMNMSGYMPLDLGAFQVRDSETLYQLIRFSGQPEIQLGMLAAKNGFAAKIVGRPHRQTKTVHGWDALRFPVMKWCLGIKVYQWPRILTAINENLDGRELVEKSSKDPMWGCLVRDGRLVGVNALGQCWHSVLHLADLWPDNRRIFDWAVNYGIGDLTIQTMDGLVRLGDLDIPRHPPKNCPKEPVINTTWPPCG